MYLQLTQVVYIYLFPHPSNLWIHIILGQNLVELKKSIYLHSMWKAIVVRLSAWNCCCCALVFHTRIWCCAVLDDFWCRALDAAGLSKICCISMKTHARTHNMLCMLCVARSGQRDEGLRFRSSLRVATPEVVNLIQRWKIYVYVCVCGQTTQSCMQIIIHGYALWRRGMRLPGRLISIGGFWY